MNGGPAILPEQQAAIDATIANLNKMGITEGITVTYDVDQGVVCADGAGAEVCVDGKFSLEFAQESLAASGILEATSYKPGKGNVPTNTSTGEVRTNYLIPAIQIWYKNQGLDSSLSAGGTFTPFMIDPDSLSWGAVLRVPPQEGGNPKERVDLMFKTQAGEILSVPLSDSVYGTTVLSYWMNK